MLCICICICKFEFEFGNKTSFIHSLSLNMKDRKSFIWNCIRLLIILGLQLAVKLWKQFDILGLFLHIYQYSSGGKRIYQNCHWLGLHCSHCLDGKTIKGVFGTCVLFLEVRGTHTVARFAWLMGVATEDYLLLVGGWDKASYPH